MNKQFLHKLYLTSMAEYKYKIKKLNGNPITPPAYPPEYPAPNIMWQTFIDYAGERTIPSWERTHLLKTRVKHNLSNTKYVKYATIRINTVGKCIYSSIKPDGKFIAVAETVTNSGELDIHKINVYVYTLPEMELVTETLHELNGEITVEVRGAPHIFFNGGILWHGGYKYNIVTWDTYRLAEYNNTVRAQLYTNGDDGIQFIYEYGIPLNEASKYKYIWRPYKACVEVYMNALDAEPMIETGLFTKYVPDAGCDDNEPGPNNLKHIVLESMFQELPAELIIGIFDYMTVDDKLELLRD